MTQQHNTTTQQHNNTATQQHNDTTTRHSDTTAQHNNTRNDTRNDTTTPINLGSERSFFVEVGLECRGQPIGDSCGRGRAGDFRGKLLRIGGGNAARRVRGLEAESIGFEIGDPFLAVGGDGRLGEGRLAIRGAGVALVVVGLGA